MWGGCLIVITSKQIIVEIPNLVFYICISFKYYFNFLWRSINRLYTEAHKRILKHYGLRTEILFLLVKFNAFKVAQNMMKWTCIFGMVKKMYQQNRVWIAFIVSLQEHTKEFRYIRDSSRKWLKAHFELSCAIFKRFQFKKYYMMCNSS